VPIPGNAYVAPSLLLLPAGRFDGKSQQQMTQRVTEWFGPGSAWARQRRRLNVTVRVWRRVAGVPQGLFTFAGAVDATALHAVIQHVRRLTSRVPGPWRVEVIAAGLDEPLLREVKAALHELQRAGLPARLALASQLRPELRALLAHARLAFVPATLPH
jgi:hypothetical protein